MNKVEKTEKRKQITTELDLKLDSLKEALVNMIVSHEKEVKKRQDEIELLELQTVALKEYKIK